VPTGKDWMFPMNTRQKHKKANVGVELITFWELDIGKIPGTLTL
jgi:hypothetical protein